MLKYTDKQFLNQISKAVNADKLVLFVGAGISKLCGLPLWYDLAVKLLNFCVNNSSTYNFSHKDRNLLLSSVKDARELVTIAANIICKKSKDAFYNELCNLLKVNEHSLSEKEKQNYETVPCLIKSLSNNVITTNADTIIDKQYDGKKSIFYTKKDIEKFDIFKEKQVFHIHGSIEKPEDMVFSLTQYLRRYNYPKFRSKMQMIFNNPEQDLAILIIGYSLSELQLLDLIINNDGSQKNKRKQNIFLLKGYYSYEDNVYEAENEYYKEYGITLVSYLMDEKGYQGLVDALQDIKQYVGDKTKQSINQIKRVVDLFKKQPNQRNINMFLNLFSEFDDRKKGHAFSELQRSQYHYQWLDKMIDNVVCFNKYFCVDKNLPKCIEDRSAFPGCQLILRARVSNVKDKKKYKKYIKEVLEHFINDNTYFNNKTLADDVCRAILTNYEYFVMPEAYEFITKFDKQEYRSDWILFLCHQNDVLLKVNKDILFKYVSFALKSFYENDDKEYYFDLFLDVCSLRLCSDIPDRMVSFCEKIIDEITKKENPFYPRDTFEELSRNDSYHGQEHYIYKVFLLCLSGLKNTKIASYYAKYKNKRTVFYTQLSIYIASIRYPELENCLFDDLLYYASDKKYFAEIYSCFSRNSYYISDDKVMPLLNFIRKIKFKGYSEIWNLTARRYLLQTLSKNPKFTNNDKYNSLCLETEKTIDGEYSESINTMPTPLDMSKSIWSSSAYWVNDKSLQNELNVLDDCDYFERIKKANYDDYEILDSIRDTLESRVKAGFIDFLERNHLLKDIPFKLACIIISTIPKASDSVENNLRSIIKIVNSSEDENLKRKLKKESFSTIYFIIHGINRSKIDSVLLDDVFNYAFDNIYSSDSDWLIDGKDRSPNLHTVFSARVFEWLNVLIMTCSHKNWNKLLDAYNSWLFDDAKKTSVKASLCGNLTTLWTLDFEFVKKNIRLLFDNIDNGVNYSNIGFQLSMFYSPDFITLLHDNKILVDLVSDENFGLNWNYVYLIIWQYLYKRIDISVLEEVIVCHCSASAISSLIMDLEKMSIQDIPLDALSDFLKLIANTKFDDSDHCAVGFYKLSEKLFNVKNYVEALISLFSSENSATYVKDLLEHLSKSKLSDHDNEAILKTFLEHLKDHYLFVDEIQELLDAIKWSSEDSKIETVNKLGKINPAFQIRYKEND